jgi:hypothetical protein
VDMGCSLIMCGHGMFSHNVWTWDDINVAFRDSLVRFPILNNELCYFYYMLFVVGMYLTNSTETCERITSLE